MRYAKPISLGALLGLFLALAALAGAYLSPWRQALYFSGDPELADLRSKLEGYQEWLSFADSRIALRGPEADSLRAEQASVWRDYKSWRTRMGELARAHSRPSGEGFLRWAWSLRFRAGPAVLGCLLLSAGWAGWRARNRYRPGRIRPGKAPRTPSAGAESGAHARAVSEFEAAVKQVARIARQEAKPEPRPAAGNPVIAFPDGTGTPPAREPETERFEIPPAADASRGEDGRETRFLHIGAGWDAADSAPADAFRPAPGLSMEDEDSQPQGNAQVTPGAMPPTTEVERVERRKDEVLKLARKGMTSSEISRRMRISQDQVEFIIRLRREKG